MSQPDGIPAVIIWDDELASAPPMGCYRNLVPVLRPHADEWFEDIRRCRPVCGLLDNDMGREHLRGTDIVGQIRRRFPLLMLLCISANTAACFYMVRSGVSCFPKDFVNPFLKRLDMLLDGRFVGYTPPCEANLRQLVQQALCNLAGAAFPMGECPPRAVQVKMNPTVDMKTVP